MSTKCSIVSGDNFHVYTDIFDEMEDPDADAVYVELTNLRGFATVADEDGVLTATFKLSKLELEKMIFAYAEKRAP
jgi:hypothetical protein